MTNFDIVKEAAFKYSPDLPYSNDEISELIVKYENGYSGRLTPAEIGVAIAEWGDPDEYEGIPLSFIQDIFRTFNGE